MLIGFGTKNLGAEELVHQQHWPKFALLIEGGWVGGYVHRECR